MKIKVGNTYKTSGGGTAKIIHDDGSGVAQFKAKYDDGKVWWMRGDGTTHGTDNDAIRQLLELVPEKEEKEEPKLITVHKKNNPSYPYRGWTTAMVPPPEDEQEGGGGSDGEGEDGDEDNDEWEGNEGDNAKEQPKPKNQKGEIIHAHDGILVTYDSFDDMIDDADDQHKSRSVWWSRASRDGNNEEWYGTRTFKEAVDLARNGWPKGVTKMNATAEEFTRRTRWTTDRALEHDVGGAYPDVPVFLSGDPANMINTGDNINRVKPMVHVVVNRWTNCSFGPEQIFNFGAAMSVCIDQIEACGSRVQLDIVGATRSLSNRSKCFRIHSVVKRPQEHMEKNRMSFALANAALLRRIHFSILEQRSPEAVFKNGYGQPAEWEKEQLPPGVLYIPSLQSFGGRSWENIDTAVKELQKFFGLNQDASGLITFGKEAA